MHKDDKKEWPLLQTALEGGEVLAKIGMSEGVLKDIPYIGTMFGVLKAALDYRDRVLQAKLAAFLTEDRLRSALETEEMLARLRDSEQAERIGIQLFLVIEKVTDFAKPSIVARIFSGFLEGKVNAETLLQLVHIVDIAYTGDLIAFERAQGVSQYGVENARLANAGLLQGHAIQTIGGGGMRYHVTDLGRDFLAALA